MKLTKPRAVKALISDLGRGTIAIELWKFRWNNSLVLLPLPAQDQVLLGHGSGGRLSAELLQKVFLPAFQNPALNSLNDQAIVDVDGVRLAFTTDSFVVKPLFFPGGDIGSLAVNGTINDLAMGGAEPICLSAAFILEEGLPWRRLQRVVASLGRAAREAGVAVVTGDTKVVEKGKGRRAVHQHFGNRPRRFLALIFPPIRPGPAIASFSAGRLAITASRFFPSAKGWNLTAQS